MPEEIDNRKTHLQTLLNDLTTSIVVKEMRYFHLRTIENLIFHFDEIKTESDKTWVFETLCQYFKKCTESLTSINRDSSKNLFDEYLDKITGYYHSNLGFSVLMNRVAVYFIYLVALGLSYYFFKPFVVIGLAAIFILQIFLTFEKYRKKKVYALFW